jgi:hypothetical protein
MDVVALPAQLEILCRVGRLRDDQLLDFNA